LKKTSQRTLGFFTVPTGPTAAIHLKKDDFLSEEWGAPQCTHNKIAEKILADDFQGTSPEGKRYTKSEEVADTADLSKAARDCRLIDAKVRFFGDDLAMVYGSESSVPKAKDGAERSRCLIWTDTWLKRSGNWQIIAAQDTQFDC